MVNHPCPNCAEKLNLHQGTRILEKYCCGCGYEAREENDLVPLVVPQQPKLLSLAKKRREKNQKIKQTRDKEDYVPRRAKR